MAQVLVLYKTPTDKAAFDKYYAETHIPLAKKIPGMKTYEISQGTINGAGSESIHLVATLTFDSMEALQAAFGSPEGQAAASDLPHFASGGADLLMFDTKAV